MKVCILYHPNSEFARGVEMYVQDFMRLKGKQIELLSLENKDGAAMASLYDIMQYPAMLAIREDGQLMKDWQGEQLPLMNEVLAYFEV